MDTAGPSVARTMPQNTIGAQRITFVFMGSPLAYVFGKTCSYSLMANSGDVFLLNKGREFKHVGLCGLFARKTIKVPQSMQPRHFRCVRRRYFGTRRPREGGREMRLFLP